MDDARKLHFKITSETYITNKYYLHLHSCCIDTVELANTLNESSFDNYITGDFAVHISYNLYVVTYSSCDAYDAEEERAEEIKRFVENCTKVLLGSDTQIAI